MKKIVIGTRRMGGASRQHSQQERRTRFRPADRVPVVLRQPPSADSWACGCRTSCPVISKETEPIDILDRNATKSKGAERCLDLDLHCIKTSIHNTSQV